MDRSKTNSYYIKQVERERKRMLAEISQNDKESDSDIAFSDPDTDDDDPIPQVPSGSGKDVINVVDQPSNYSPFLTASTVENVLIEVRGVLSQVRKLSKEAEERDNSQIKEIKKLKRDVEMIRDTLVNTRPLKIQWPIDDVEKFEKLDEKIRTNNIYADQMVKLLQADYSQAFSNIFNLSDRSLQALQNTPRPAKTVFG